MVNSDKREFERFSPQGNAYAAYGLQYTKVGRIKDISLGGLAFEYISEMSPDQDSSQIDIFLVGDVFHMYNIPCQVIYDIPNPSHPENIGPIKVSPVKRCGIQFGTLTEDDAVQLKLFLESHTIR
jgi:hypothetical protein